MTRNADRPIHGLKARTALLLGTQVYCPCSFSNSLPLTLSSSLSISTPTPSPYSASSLLRVAFSNRKAMQVTNIIFKMLVDTF